MRLVFLCSLFFFFCGGCFHLFLLVQNAENQSFHDIQTAKNRRSKKFCNVLRLEIIRNICKKTYKFL